jgi:hypothetical protein
MDHFNGLKNEDLIAYFLVDLNSRKELTQYTYPHEMMEPQEAIDDHVIRCQNILWDFLYETVSETDFEAGISLNSSQLNEIVTQKKEELIPFFEPIITKYIEDVKVTYIDLRKGSE